MNSLKNKKSNKKDLFMLIENINRLIFIVDKIRLLMWYGYVIVWIMSVYYKTLRSRVMLSNFMLWKVVISFYKDFLVSCNDLLKVFLVSIILINLKE